MAADCFKSGELLEAAAMARRYYLDGRTKLEIAEEFRVSRFRVARIWGGPARAGSCASASSCRPGSTGSCRKSCGWHWGYTMRWWWRCRPNRRNPCGSSSGGRGGAALGAGEGRGRAGGGMGRTLDAMAQALTSLAPCTVVQLTGASGARDVSEESVEIVQRLATISGGTACPIYAPLVLDTAETAAALRRQPHVAEALSRFDELTIAVMAVGTWDPPNSRLRSSLAEAERRGLQDKGVEAEVCASLLDASGRVLQGEYLSRTIAIRPEQLRRVPELIAVAGGPSKVGALRALLAAGLATSVVTDAASARALLALPPLGAERAKRRGSPAQSSRTSRPRLTTGRVGGLGSASGALDAIGWRMGPGSPR